MLTIKQLIPSLLFYAFAAAAIFILNRFSPSGPCTPGMGILAFFLLLPTIIVLLLRNIYLAVKVDRINIANAVLHGIALCIIFLILQSA